MNATAICNAAALAQAVATSWVVAGVLGALLALGVGLWWRNRRRLFELRRAVDRITSGQSGLRLPRYGSGEVGSLSRSLDRMAGEFYQRLRSLRQQRNETEAVLGSMVEGVIAIDSDERVVSLNPAAAELLRLDANRAVGRSIQEAIRNTALQQFVSRAMSEDRPTQGDLVLRVDTETGSAERFLQAQAAPLSDAAGQRIGVLIVMHDVTRLRRLEVIRRDFVANVSHEIKTPITAIKGAVETLDDAVDDLGLDDSARRFLGIIARQADRLHNIVEDLLSLARIEQETERDRIALERVDLNEVARAAVSACMLQADAKQIEVELRRADSAEVMANAQLLEQAVINLLDNAIKYSPSGTRVSIACAAPDDDAGAQVIVSDQGVGIDSDHLPRLFERFYRTDKARSRAQGGTGLGLAIVKHIAQAHGGTVSVESQVGRGSTFRIHLPAAAPVPAEA